MQSVNVFKYKYKNHTTLGIITPRNYCLTKRLTPLVRLLSQVLIVGSNNRLCRIDIRKIKNRIGVEFHLEIQCYSH